MHILLDLDGTLTDPKVGILTSLQYALQELGEDVPRIEDLEWCIGPPLKDAFVEFFDDESDPRVEKGVAYFRERFGDVGLFENEVYEGIPEILEALVEQDHQLHLATSKPEVFARRILDHFDIADPFTSINGSELDGTRSEKKKLISYIINKQNIGKDKSIMIGDRKHDIIGAIGNEMPGIGVLWGYGSREELEQAGAEYLIESPQDLGRDIEKLFS